MNNLVTCLGTCGLQSATKNLGGFSHTGKEEDKLFSIILSVILLNLN